MERSQQRDDEIDLGVLLSEIMAHWRFILGMLLIGLLIGLFYIGFVSPTYSSNAIVQVDKQSRGVSALGEDLSKLLATDASPAQAEIELMKSRMVLIPVIEALHLDISIGERGLNLFDNLPFVKKNRILHSEQGVSYKDNVLIGNFSVPLNYVGQDFTIAKKDDTQFVLKSPEGEEFQGTIGNSQVFKSFNGNINIEVKKLPVNGQVFSLKKTPMPDVIDELLQALSITEKGKQTGILSATLYGKDQQYVTETLTKIILSYEKQNQVRSSEETATTLKFMEEQLPILKKRLNESELVFNIFRKEKGTVNIDKEAELTLSEGVAVQTNLQELEIKKAELRSRYTELHPLMKQINAQISQLKSRQTALKTRISQMPALQRKFMELAADVQINREIFMTMLKNYEQFRIVKSGQIGYVRVVDLPISTGIPVAPKKLQVLLLATLLGGVLGIAWTILHNALRRTVKDPDALEKETGVPVIATIPRSEKIVKNQLVNVGSAGLIDKLDEHSNTSEGIKNLRTHLIFALPSERGNVILITGASPGVGKSFVSANLAVAIAKINKKVLLIDADMRLGHLHKYFNLNLINGFADCLKGHQKNLKNFTQKTTYENLSFIPRGHNPDSPSELLMDGDLAVLIQEALTEYDYVIIDSPPVLAASDTTIIAKQVDLTVMVARYGESSAKQLAYAIKVLNQSGISTHGIIFNDTQQVMTEKYNYHYSHSYHQAS